VDYYDALDLILGDDAEFMIENTCSFPGIPGAFGTADLIAWSPRLNRTHVTDWKFGVGEAVFASYDEGEFERINEQLLYYACAARHTHPEMFGDRSGEVVLTIVQPRAQDERARISQTTVTHDELTAFEGELAAAVLAGKLPNPPMALGKWCRWCVAKTICPLQRKPVLELSNVVRLPAREEPSYRELLLSILEVAEPLEDVIREARRQAKALLEANQPLEGWKLVPARANRTWDALEAAVVRFMRKHGVKKAQLFETKFLSPAQAEKLLPRGVKLPPQILKQESKSTTLAKASDRRPAVPAVAAIGKLLAGIKERA
jgi:hypothetical protein